MNEIFEQKEWQAQKDKEKEAKEKRKIEFKDGVYLRVLLNTDGIERAISSAALLISAVILSCAFIIYLIIEKVVK